MCVYICFNESEGALLFCHDEYVYMLKYVLYTKEPYLYGQMVTLNRGVNKVYLRVYVIKKIIKNVFSCLYNRVFYE